MTVAELIALLSEIPGETQLELFDSGFGRAVLVAADPNADDGEWRDIWDANRP